MEEIKQTKKEKIILNEATNLCCFSTVENELTALIEVDAYI